MNKSFGDIGFRDLWFVVALGLNSGIPGREEETAGRCCCKEFYGHRAL